MNFHILGLDIFLTSKLKLSLIEVNCLPSFATDSPLDKRIKLDLIYETIAMLNLNTENRKKLIKDELLRKQHKEGWHSKQERDQIKNKL